MPPGPAGGVKTRELTERVALDIYETVATIVAAENRITRGLNGGEFTMTFYPVRGQEIIPATVSSHLGNDDYMVTTYRGVHDCIAKGIPLTELMAEMLRQVDGHIQGQGRPHAPLRSPLGPDGDHRDRRWRVADRRRSRPGRQAARYRAGDRGQLRRRRNQHRRRARGGEHGGVVGVAGHLRLPEQRLRRAHCLRRLHPHDQSGRALQAVRHGGHHGRRQQRARLVRGGRRSSRARTKRRRSDLPRVHDVPPRGALLRRDHRVRRC